MVITENKCITGIKVRPYCRYVVRSWISAGGSVNLDNYGNLI
jgi:hypothetical protein